MTAPSGTATATPDVGETQARARYDAFISYSHHADGQLAPRLQDALHRFAKPWYRLRALRVFRDEASLAATPALWESITEALEAAQYFVLLASPDAKSSEWVAREASWWRERKAVDRILIVLTAGDIEWDDGSNDFDWPRTDALPDTLGRCFPAEPRWIDLRWARTAEHLTLRNPRFRDAVAEVAAPLHGRPKDELIGEDVRQHRRAVRLARAAVATLVVLLIAALGSAVFALNQRNSARAERDRAQQQARIATSRLLAGQAVTDLARSPDRSILLSLEAFRLQPTFEARASVVQALQHTQREPAVLRPGGDVLSVQFSRDGRTLMTTGDDERVRLWNVATDRQLRPSFHCNCLLTTSGALLMPDGKRVVAADGSDSSSITFSSLRTGKALREVSDPAGGVEGLAVSSDGHFMASFGSNRPVVVWDARTAHALGPLRGTGSESTWNVGFSPDGRLLAVDDATRGLELWNVATRRPVVRLAAPGSWTRSFAFARDDKRIAFEDDAGIHVRNLATGAVHGRPIVVGSSIMDIAFDPTGRLLAVAGQNGLLRIFDATGRSAGAALTGHENTVEAVAFSPDGRTLASAGQDGTVHLWTVASDPLGKPVAPLSMLASDADGRLIAADSRDGSVQLVRPKDWALARTLRGTAPNRVAAFNPAGTLVAVGLESGIVTIRNTATGRSVETRTLGSRRDGPIVSVAFSPDGRYLAAIGQREWLRVWRVGSWKLVGVDYAINDASPPGLGVAIFAPDGSLVTAGSGGVAVWHIRNDRLAKPQLIDLDVSPGTAALSPDGHTLALGTDEDSLVRLLDLRTRKQLEPLAGHSDGVDSLAFSPDGRVLASASGIDETVRLWDVASGRPLTGGLRSDAGAPISLAFSPSGDHLFSTQDSTLVSWDPILWRGTLAEFQKRLCPIAGRNLRRGEWQRFLPGVPYHITCPDE